MKTKPCLIRGSAALLLAIAGALLSAFPAEAQNLITNGDFESPVLGYGNYELFGVGSTALPGWTILDRDVLLMDTNRGETDVQFNAYGGDQALDITGNENVGPDTGIAQTVATTPDASYLVSFAVGRADDSGSPDPGYVGPATVDLSIDGGARMPFTNSGLDPNHVDWEVFTYAFTAASGSTQIAFYNDTPSISNYAGLDAVTVSPVPEPGVCTMLPAGAAGLFAMRRRCRQTGE